MSTIQSDVSSVWQACQSNIQCQVVARMAAIPDYQKLYDDYSASFTGQAATDFNTWRFDIGVAEGDIKQWDVNEIFQQPKPNPINSIDQEIQNAQNDSANFSKD